MKIAIPTRNQVVDNHFGHCEYYTIYTIDENQKIINQTRDDSPEGCGCKSNIASVLEEKGVTLMLAGNMGVGAKNKLESHHIQVIRGCSGPVEQVLNDWLQGKIKDSGELCDHHECGSHSINEPLTFKVL